MVEVHRLPDVERDRAFAAPADRADGRGSGGRPRRGRRRTRRTARASRTPRRWRATSPGSRSSPPPSRRLAGADLLGEVAVVAAPGGVDRPVAPGEVEPGVAGVQYVRGVRAGAAATVLPQVDAGEQGAALRQPLLIVLPGEVEQFVRLRGDGEQTTQSSTARRRPPGSSAWPASASGRSDSSSSSSRSARAPLVVGGLEDERDPVLADDQIPRRRRRRTRPRWSWSAGTSPVRPMTLRFRVDPSSPWLLGQDRDARRRVDIVGSDDGDARVAQPEQRVVIELSELMPPAPQWTIEGSRPDRASTTSETPA